MSVIRQVLLSLIVVAVAVTGWLAYDRGYFSAVETESAGSPEGRGLPGGRFGSAAAPVIAAEVETDDIGLDVHAIGTVAAARAVTLYPQVTGVVTDVAFVPGTRVEAGETLIRLDDADQQVSVERARIALDNARLALARASRLAESNNITSVALADAETAVRQAEIDLKSAEIDLGKRTLAAPFAGTIGLSDISVGDLVSSSKAIASLDDMSTVTVAFAVPERASGRVAVGQEVTATTVALAGRRFVGSISAVDSRVDPVARTLKVEATLPNDANVLKPGMALSVMLGFPGERHPVVPSLAVQWDRGGPYVWKLDGDTVHRVGVDILGRRSGVVIVAGELAPGDEVVAEGIQRLREGAPVTRVGPGGGEPLADRPDVSAATGGAGANVAPARRRPSG